jgi:hypothetical protein
MFFAVNHPIWTCAHMDLKVYQCRSNCDEKKCCCLVISQIGNRHYLLFPKMGFRCLKSNVDSLKMLYKPILDVIVMVFWWYNYL